MTFETFTLILINTLLASTNCKILRIPALSKDGYVGLLGGLYSDVENYVIPGLSAFKHGNIPIEQITMSTLGDTSCNSEIVHDQVEKNLAAGMSSEIELAVYSGAVSLTGSAKVFRDFTLSEENINALLTYEHRSFQEIVSIEKEQSGLINQSDMDYHHASHVITGVEWGVRVYCAFSFKVVAGMNRSKFEADVEGELAFLSSGLESRTNKNIENLTLLRSSQCNMAFYADILLNKTVPRNLPEMINIVNSIPEAIQASYSGKGRQRYYILTPIHYIQRKFNQTVTRKGLTKQVVKDEDMFELRYDTRTTFMLNAEIRKIYNELLKDYENFNYMVHPDSVWKLSSLYLNYSTVYYSQYIPKIQDIIRLTQTNQTQNATSDIRKITHWYRNNSFGALKTFEDLRFLRLVMKNKIIYNTIFNQNGVKFLKQEGTSPQILLRNMATDVHVLIISRTPNISHTAGDINTEVLRSINSDPYDRWLFKLQALFVFPGPKYIADCRVETIVECESVYEASILHYKRGIIVSRNKTIKAFEESQGSEPVHGTLIEDVEYFENLEYDYIRRK